MQQEIGYLADDRALVRYDSRDGIVFVGGGATERVCKLLGEMECTEVRDVDGTVKYHSSPLAWNFHGWNGASAGRRNPRDFVCQAMYEGIDINSLDSDFRFLCGDARDARLDLSVEEGFKVSVAVAQDEKILSSLAERCDGYMKRIDAISSELTTLIEGRGYNIDTLPQLERLMARSKRVEDELCTRKGLRLCLGDNLVVIGPSFRAEYQGVANDLVDPVSDAYPSAEARYKEMRGEVWGKLEKFMDSAAFHRMEMQVPALVERKKEMDEAARGSKQRGWFSRK